MWYPVPVLHIFQRCRNACDHWTSPDEAEVSPDTLTLVLSARCSNQRVIPSWCLPSWWGGWQDGCAIHLMWGSLHEASFEEDDDEFCFRPGEGRGVPEPPGGTVRGSWIFGVETAAETASWRLRVHCRGRVWGGGDPGLSIRAPGCRGRLEHDAARVRQGSAGPRGLGQCVSRVYQEEAVGFRSGSLRW